MHPLQRLRSHPLLLLCSAALMILGLTGALLHGWSNARQQEQQARHYGQALADNGAVRALEPTLAQDMISLQVILQSITDQPRVRLATIHDVENRLLVQSGQSDPPAEGRHPSFTTPITVDNNIAGYLTVTLTLPGRWHQQAGPLALWTALVGLALTLVWGIGLRLDRPERQAPPAEPPPSDTPDEKPEASVCLELVFLNLQRLEDQLSKEGLHQRLNRFDKHLRGVMTLYEARKASVQHHKIRLEVYGEHTSAACFHALCLAELLRRLARHGERPRLQLAANIREANHSSNAPLLDALRANEPPRHAEPAIWLDPNLTDLDLSRQIALDDNHCLTDIHPPYQALLERQEQQLVQV